MKINNKLTLAETFSDSLGPTADDIDLVMDEIMELLEDAVQSAGKVRGNLRVASQRMGAIDPQGAKSVRRLEKEAARLADRIDDAIVMIEST